MKAMRTRRLEGASVPEARRLVPVYEEYLATLQRGERALKQEAAKLTQAREEAAAALARLKETVC